MQKKAEIMDENAMKRVLTRIAFQIIEKNHGVKDIILAGIHTRGVPIAKRIAEQIFKVEGVKVPVIELDVSSLRDDVPRNSIKEMSFPNVPSLQNSIVILVDDVLYTGRTVRAGIEAILKMGRASRIQLAVMVDRGHRELPIRPDYVGKNLPTAQSERVCVNLKEIDNLDSVVIMQEK